VVVWVCDEVLHRRKPQGLMLGVELALAEIEIANFHNKGAPDSGW
jgi:hypothetical protein